MSIVKTVNVSGVVLNGALVEYTINVTNHGPDTATNVNITDVLDNKLIFIGANGTYTRVGQTVNWTISSILNGESYIINLIVKLNGTGNISNVANVTGTDQNNAGNNSSNGNDSNITVIPSVDLELRKTANVTKTFVGRFVKYTLVVVNHGPDIAHNVTVYDRLESKLSFVNATSSNYDPVTGIWFVGDLSMDVSATLVIIAKVISPGHIINVANVSSDDNIRNSSYVSNATNRTVIINASKVPTPLDINTTTIVVVDNKTGKVGVPLNLTATLTDDKGKPIAGMPIKFYINGKYIGTRYTDVKGLAFITYIPVSSGKFTITAEFQGRTGFKACKVNGLLIVKGKGKDNNNDKDGKAGMKHTGIPVVLLIILLILLTFVSRIRKRN
ncbi:bacterial Ig-like domain protein [Methanobrevibacter curvatus]|uniref:Bacterial Ig-like domain protein n=1 Tax=Methanobrevibacter curvatus TaxID=49547 RepID=A0A166CUI8_9EURY|nr:bacterial Ig-like domain protein [Methanobrevibacter curvatus]